MLRASVVAAVLGLGAGPQGMPVTRLAGGGPQAVAELCRAGGSEPSACRAVGQGPGDSAQLPPLPVTQIDPRDTTPTRRGA